MYISGIFLWDWFTAGEDVDVYILVLWWYGICDLMSLQLLCRLYPGRNHRETSQRSFLVKASWHAPLICPLTKEKEQENWTQLRTETLFKGLLNWKRVLALKTQIFDSISATVSASSSSISSNLGLDLLKQPGGDISPSDGAYRWCQLVTVEGGKTLWALLWKLFAGLVSKLFDSQSKFSRTVDRTKIN